MERVILVADHTLRTSETPRPVKCASTLDDKRHGGTRWEADYSTRSPRFLPFETVLAQKTPDPEQTRTNLDPKGAPPSATRPRALTGHAPPLRAATSMTRGHLRGVRMPSRLVRAVIHYAFWATKRSAGKSPRFCISSNASRNESVDSAPWFSLTRSACSPSRQPPVEAS